MDSTATTTHPSSDRFAKTAHETVDKVHGAAGTAEERIREKAHAAREYGQEVGGNVSNFIRDRPLASVGIAAAVGLVIGALIRR